MSKDNKAVVLYRLQSVARLTRTVLAARLLEQGLYAGQDAVMLQLAAEDGHRAFWRSASAFARPPSPRRSPACKGRDLWSSALPKPISASRMSI